MIEGESRREIFGEDSKLGNLMTNDGQEPMEALERG